MSANPSRPLKQLTNSRRQARAPLTRDDLRFVNEYLIDLDPGAAARRAGLDPAIGSVLLSTARIQGAIQIAKSRRADRTEIYIDSVLGSWECARRVDYNEFVSVIVPPCRYCWGTNHHYQFTTFTEMKKLAEKHSAEQEQLPPHKHRDFDTEGGEGYDSLKQPCRGPEWAAMGMEVTSDHSCPECNGLGATPRLLLRDTRYLSPGARYLYEGASRSKDGDLKLNLRSRRDFDEMVGRHLGLFGAPSHQPPPADPGRMSDEQLDAVLQAYGVTVDAEFEEITEDLVPEK